MKFSASILILILNLSACSYALPQGIFGLFKGGVRAAAEAGEVGVGKAGKAGAEAGAAAGKGAVRGAVRGAGIAGSVASSARGIEAAGTSLSHAGTLPSIARPGVLKPVTAAEQASATSARNAAQAELNALKRAREAKNAAAGLCKRGGMVCNNFKVYAGNPSSRLSQDIKKAFARSKRGGARPNGGQGHANDGIVFQNKEGALPTNDVYTEWGLASNRGFGNSFTNNQRLVVGKKSGNVYYTPDHYKTFQVVPRKILQ